MNLPTRTIQKQHEAESYAILLYALRKVGIFRNLTENDYGIDFEIELVQNNQVTGRYMKVQVKSAEDVYIRTKDKVPTVGGISQSTLNYWAELSYSTNVIVYAVNLKTEAIYMTKPIFWQATQLLDGTGKTKSIEFLPADKCPKEIANVLTSVFMFAPTIREQQASHRSALRQLKDFLELYANVFWLDAHCCVDNRDVFSEFLTVSKELLWHVDVNKEFSSEHKDKWGSVDHWNNEYGELINYTCQTPMKALMPLLLRELRLLRMQVMSGGLYWLANNREYLRLVFLQDIPDAPTHDVLCRFSEEYDKTVLKRSHEFYNYVETQIVEPYKALQKKAQEAEPI